MSETTSKSQSTGNSAPLGAVATQELRDAGAFLLWARRNAFALSRVKVGHVEIDIAADLEVQPQAPSLASTRSEQDPYEVYGGEALKRLREQEQSAGDKASALVEDDDDE